MEIVKVNSATLCNNEVMQHLQVLKDSKKKHKGQLATITYETLRYLENSPCYFQTSESITSCLKDFEPYNLNKMEKLMLVNTPPATALEIQSIIEEGEERLTDEQVGEILQILVKHFPHIQKLEPEVEEGE